MQRIPVCPTWARHWAEFEEHGGLTLRAQSDARSKIGHLALWVMRRTGSPVAAWADVLALLDRGGVAEYIKWKQHEAPEKRWSQPSSVKRGCGVLAKFFGAETSVARGCGASQRIAKAFRTYKP